MMISGSRLLRALAGVLAAAVTASAGAALVAGQAQTPAADGWISLFDGKSLNGWRGYKKTDAANTRWVVNEGMLCLAPAAGKDTRGALDIVSTNKYEQFDLTWEWRVSEGGNSGLKYFVLEDMDSAIGHEYQMIDDDRHPDAKIGPHRQTAAFYDVLPAINRPLKPAGQFNESRVLVSGQTVEHWLNGTKVLTYQLGSPDLAAAIAKSKFKDVARFGKRHSAHILVQDHGDAVCYRNIRIKPLK
jgi:hypothetical protein